MTTTFGELKSLINARVLVETSLQIVCSTRRKDGGWILWFDPIESMLDPGTIRSAGGTWEALWNDIDAALDLLEQHGWLVRNESWMVTVSPKGCAQ